MNELKTEDVMRALECCSHPNKCRECPYSGMGKCWDMKQDAIAILREKDAEIERLQKLVRTEVQIASDAIKEVRETARAEAITEFLEKAKHHSREVGRLKPFVLLEDLQFVGKEILGEYS